MPINFNVLISGSRFTHVPLTKTCTTTTLLIPAGALEIEYLSTSPCVESPTGEGDWSSVSKSLIVRCTKSNFPNDFLNDENTEHTEVAIARILIATIHSTGFDMQSIFVDTRGGVSHTRHIVLEMTEDVEVGWRQETEQ